MRKEKPKYRVQGISFPDEALYLAAVEKARAQRRSLSNYICGLLEEDIRNAELEEHRENALNDAAKKEVNSSHPKKDNPAADSPSPDGVLGILKRRHPLSPK